MTLPLAEAEKILADNFAPWVLDLGLSVVGTGERHAVCGCWGSPHALRA